MITTEQALAARRHRPDPALDRLRRGTCARRSRTSRTTRSTSTSSTPRTATASTATASGSTRSLESIKIVRQCVERMPRGDYRVQDNKVTPPPRARIDESMEALIHHFKLFTEGFRVPAGETYVADRVAAGRDRLLPRVRRHREAVPACTSAARPSTTCSRWRPMMRGQPGRRRGRGHLERRPDHGRGRPVDGLHAREPRTAPRDRGAVPVREVGGAAAAAPRAGPGRLGHARARSTRSPSSSGSRPPQVLGTCCFYTMYKREPVGQLVVSVCTNVSCLVNGGPELLETSQAVRGRRRREVEEVECLAACDIAPVFQVNYEFHGTAHADESADRRSIEEYRSRRARRRATISGTRRSAPDGGEPRPGSSRSACATSRRLVDIDRYLANRRRTSSCAGADDGARRPSGRAGEGVGPARPGRRRVRRPGRSGRSCRRASTRATSSVNGDEGEPSTFKDHMLVERDPHQLDRGRRSSPRSRSRRTTRSSTCAASSRSASSGSSRRVADAYAQGLHRQEHPRLRLRPRGRRAPRRRLPTSPATRPACSRASRASGDAAHQAAVPRGRRASTPQPTVVNNVETLSTVPHIMRDGRRVSTPSSASSRSTGTRIFSVSGHVERPGNYEVELGITFRDLIEGLAGGVRGGKQMKFFIPGGASAPWLMPRAPRRAARHGLRAPSSETMLGSGAIMVFDEDHRPAARRVAAREVLRPRELRQVHAVPRGLGVDREGAVPDLARPRPARGPRPDARRSATTSCPGSTRRSRRPRSARSGRARCRRVVSLDRFFREEIVERMASDADASPTRVRAAS